jgi:DNA repair exonuclease SbcCD nuclease subunit
MPKFVTLTDTHLRVTTPVSRTEKDWLSTLLAKIKFAFETAVQHDACAILCSGDLGDEANWSPRAIVQFQRLVQQYDIPFVTTIGQHDVYGHKIDEWEYTGMGIIASTGCITVLHAGQSIEVDGCTIYGYGFNEPETLGLLAGDPNYVPPKTPMSIGLIHASIGAEESFGWASVENVAIKNINICSFGDIHAGFDITKPPKSDALCYSTGSIARSSASDIGRDCLIALIDITPEGVEFETIQVPCAKGDDAFTALALSKHYGTAVADGVSDEFVNILKTIQSTNDESTKARVLRIGRELGYSDSVIELVANNTEEQQ